MNPFQFHWLMEHIYEIHSWWSRGSLVRRPSWNLWSILSSSERCSSMLSGYIMWRNIRKALRCSMEIHSQNWWATSLSETSKESSSSSSWSYPCRRTISWINCLSSSHRQLVWPCGKSSHKWNPSMMIMDAWWSWPRSCQGTLQANRLSTNRFNDLRWQSQRWKNYRRSCKRSEEGKDARCRKEVS